MLATDLYGQHVKAIRADQWSNPTPCTEWDVRALVNHVVGEQLWVIPLLEGKTVADVGSALDGDLLGDDPLATWEGAVAASRKAFAAPAALDSVVHLSFGDETGAGYCDQMALDALIHGWDLAKAIGADDTLPTASVAWALAQIEPIQQMLEASGVYGTRQSVPEDASPQVQLLARLGRTA